MNADEECEFGDYVAARSDGLCRFAYLLSGDWNRPDDTVQTALTKLYVAWRRLGDRGSLDAYVRRIILNLLASERLLVRFRRERLSGDLPERTDGSDLAGSANDRMAVLAALATVPPRQRAVIVLRYWEDQSVEQVAEALYCSTADWSRAIAWFLSACSLAGSRRDSRDGSFASARHAVRSRIYTTRRDATLTDSVDSQLDTQAIALTDPLVIPRRG